MTRKQRAERPSVDWREPIPLPPLRAATETEPSARLDHNPSGRGERSRRRARDRSTEPLPLSDLQLFEARAVFAPLWEIAQTTELRISELPHIGRPRTTTAVEVLLMEMVSWETGGVRGAERQLQDPVNWQRLRTAVAAAWPDDPERRLPADHVPSRRRFYDFRARHLEGTDAVEELRAAWREAAVDTALTIGCFNPSTGSLTHPDPDWSIEGDATWLQSMYNAAGDDLVVDPETGEITARRVDPDAVNYHDTTQSAGRSVVIASTRTDNPHERVLLDLDFKPPRGTSDGTVFTDMTIDLARSLPQEPLAVYDMALSAPDAERLLDTGIIPVSKVPRTKRNQIHSQNLGPLSFRRSDGTTRAAPVATYDGRPCLITSDADSNLFLVRLDRDQVKRTRGKRRQVPYVTWRVPVSFPGVPADLRGAVVRIRQTRTEEERNRGVKPFGHLRIFCEGEAEFARIFGRREDTESLHNDLKRRLPNRRARCVGLLRQRLSLHAYQANSCVTALIAWHLRTGGDISRWFGEWRPPGAALPVAA